MATKITIIGAGPGGYAAAIRAAQLGAEVTVIEEENMGGTCLNHGCIPSKIMKKTAETLNNFKRAGEFGVTVDGTFAPDMELLMTRKNGVIRNLAKGMSANLDNNKICFLKGRGYIKGPKLAGAHLAEGGSVDVPFDKLILATGTKPLDMPICQFDHHSIISSDDALNLLLVPDSMLIVGGGVIGCEFAFIFSSLGSKVTIVEAMTRVLPLESVDEESSKIIQREMKKRKIDSITMCTVTDVEQNSNKVCVSMGPSSFAKGPKAGNIKPKTVEVEKVLVCIGRKPSPLGMDLEEYGIKTDQKGWIIVDSHMKTGNPDIFAVGDILGPSKIMLAHVASFEGQVAAENAMGKPKEMLYDVVSGAIFTMPEVAGVGLTEAQAKDRGLNVRSDKVLFRTLGKAHVIGEIAGQAKIISDRENGKIMGVHIVGEHATDLIAEGTLALQTGCTVNDLSQTIHAHPTLSEVMMEASFKANIERPTLNIE